MAWVLIAGRVVQGLGAAAFVPASPSLLTTSGGIGLGVVATVVATAPAGLTGSALRAGFAACLAFTALGLVVLRSIRETPVAVHGGVTLPRR